MPQRRIKDGIKKKEDVSAKTNPTALWHMRAKQARHRRMAEKRATIIIGFFGTNIRVLPLEHS
jgi:hypothetical protein